MMVNTLALYLGLIGPTNVARLVTKVSGCANLWRQEFHHSVVEDPHINRNLGLVSLGSLGRLG